MTKSTKPDSSPASPPAILQAQSPALYRQVIGLRGRHYGALFPSIRDAGAADPNDFGALVWVTLDQQGHVNSTARLVADGDAGLPSEAYVGPWLAPLRDQGLRIVEFGRFIIDSTDQPTQLSRRYYGHVWAEAYRTGIDTVVMVARQSKVTLYGHCFGAQQLCADIGEDFGSGSAFSIFAWNIHNTASTFFSWAGLAGSQSTETTS